MFVPNTPSAFTPEPVSTVFSPIEINLFRLMLADCFEEVRVRNPALTTPDKEAETRERLAKAILKAVRSGEHDRERLKRYAVAFTI